MDFLTDKWHAVTAAALALPVLFTFTWLANLVAAWFGIQRGGRELPLSRSHYFFFIIAFEVAVFFIIWVAALMERLIEPAGISLLPLIEIILVGFIVFMTTRYSARRLEEIGWSPQWAWLLQVYIIGYVFTLVLLLTPPSKDIAKRFAGHKAG